MKKKISIITSDKKTHDVTIEEPENPVTIEYAINVSSMNYTQEVREAIKGLDLDINDVVQVKYVSDNIEPHEKGQGAIIKNTIKKYGI